MGDVHQPASPLRERLRRARLYLVVEARPASRPLEELLDAALRSGVDIVQLRDKEASEDALLGAAALFRRACDAHGALFLINDRPDLALAAGADGVHLGQADRPVARARAELGDELLIGLSTHSPAQLEAGVASAADYLSAGPVYPTPTKPGRPAVGLDYVRYAAARAGETPFFAIGGIDERNAAAVVAAGARRIAVVRAIRDADEPGAAAAQLRAALRQEAPAGAA